MKVRGVTQLGLAGSTDSLRAGSPPHDTQVPALCLESRGAFPERVGDREERGAGPLWGFPGGFAVPWGIFDLLAMQFLPAPGPRKVEQVRDGAGRGGGSQQGQRSPAEGAADTAHARG